MKYKILINGGNSALLRDFFVNTTDFKCMSTSGYWVDLSAHYEMFQPDVYVCISEYADPQQLSQIKRLKTNPIFCKVPVVMITDEDCFEYFSNENKYNNNVIDVILSRPITISAICDMERIGISIREAKVGNRIITAMIQFPKLFGFLLFTRKYKITGKPFSVCHIIIRDIGYLHRIAVVKLNYLTVKSFTQSHKCAKAAI